ncbi:helix-turn-helix domain-containing protein [Staphylospora marina]|uniref:helix-turn-helix domain-containing protein n=1 Tax=Staphylospora marina TaxID=2490858 RepID=UPI0013DE4C1F|nr:helix-turn-helix transcriptional regulator [Staphylospora marina]
MLQLDYEHAGKVIKSKRKELGLRQSDLVDDVIKLHTIRKAEKGEMVSEIVLKEICRKLRLDLTELSCQAQEEKCRKADTKLTLLAIEHDIDLVGPDQALESLRSLTSKTDQPWVQAYTYFLKGLCYSRKRQWLKAQNHLHKVISLSPQIPEAESSNLKAAACYELSRCSYYLNNLEQALLYVEKGLDCFLPDGDMPHIVHYLKIGQIIYLEKMDRNEEALNYLDELWQEFESIRVPDIHLTMYEVRACLMIKHGLYENAARICMEALEWSRLYGNVDRSFELWTTLGEACLGIGDLAKAERCFLMALKLEKKITRKHLLVSTHTKLGLLYLKTGQTGDAEKILAKAVQLGKKTRNDFRHCEALIFLGDCHVRQDQTDKAMQCYRQALSIAEKHRLKEQEQKILVKLARCCEKDDPKTSEKYKERFFRLHVQLIEGGEEDEAHRALH